MISEQEMEDTPIEQRRDHSMKATLNLSGEQFKIGTYHHAEGDSIFLHTPENAEPIYFSQAEATLLIAALSACQADLKEL